MTVFTEWARCDGDTYGLVISWFHRERSINGVGNHECLLCGLIQKAPELCVVTVVYNPRVFRSLLRPRGCSGGGPASESWVEHFTGDVYLLVTDRW